MAYYFTEEQKQFIRDWVAALRSGTYKQCHGKLYDAGGGMCCLGVATDLFIKLKPGLIDWAYDEDEDAYAIGENITCLPGVVKEFIGLSSNSPKVKVDFPADDGVRTEEDREFLSNMNDRGFTFEQIATYIEREYLGGPTPSEPVLVVV